MIFWRYLEFIWSFWHVCFIISIVCGAIVFLSAKVLAYCWKVIVGGFVLCVYLFESSGDYFEVVVSDPFHRYFSSGMFFYTPLIFTHLFYFNHNLIERGRKSFVERRKAEFGKKNIYYYYSL
jgi:hypothetical protein